MRKDRPFANGLANGSNRPRAPLRGWSDERAVCATLRSKAERDGRARTDRSESGVRTRQIDPNRPLPGTDAKVVGAQSEG